jgi:putative membrane protein
MFNGFSLGGFAAGASAFVTAFAAAGCFTLVFKFLYEWSTPHNEGRLIRENNVAAAISLGGALLGYVIPLASALANTVSLVEFCAWAALAGVIQILAFSLIRLLVLKDLAQRIERGEVAAAIYMATVSLIVGVLNAACITA